MHDVRLLALCLQQLVVRWPGTRRLGACHRSAAAASSCVAYYFVPNAVLDPESIEGPQVQPHARTPCAFQEGGVSKPER